MVGEKLGSYTIESILGSGAMGVVYKATHDATGRTAAVKVISAEVGQSQKGKGYERFEREYEILKQFRHPNIVRFLAFGRSKGTSYLAMEFIQGQTLEHLLQERGPLEWQEVATLAKQVCEALHYAHQHGVVHRDLKPSNLMVTETGQVKLTDFGIAKDLDATALTATGRTLGTAAYMAPEQIRGTPAVSHKTDLYALGIVMYQMLTGRLAFEGSSAVVLMHAHMSAPIPRPRDKVHMIPRVLDELVVQLMAKDPADRPWDAVAVANNIDTMLTKAQKGEHLPNAWPESGSGGDASAATRSVDDVPRTRKKSGKTRSGSGSGTSTAESMSNRTRQRLEIGAMLLALVAIAAFFGYMFWPPSAHYLFAQAERLMASEDRHKWKEAVKDYLDPLDQRFPDHAYKPQTRGWRDRLMLTEAEGRARTLESPALTQLNKPQNKNEERYVVYYTRAAAAEKVKNDAAAVAVWEEMDKQLQPEDSDDRPWHLLARKRIDDLNKSIAQRTELVMKLLEEVKKAIEAGQIPQAQALRDDLIHKYGDYPELKSLLGLESTTPAPPSSPAPVDKEPAAAPPPASLPSPAPLAEPPATTPKATPPSP